MHLVYLPANQAWVVVFGDQLIRLEHSPTRFFDTYEDACAALLDHGLYADEKGAVYSDGPNPFTVGQAYFKEA